ncbi:galanin receptor 2b-like [Physella acuta]|uniref:galanin receptor 2b-like n=1 Tax=Physella acuta TaxID=109671 RepID=UPI0027DDED6C|nr:galanin receptor 2b-like [Physella acuta]
MSSLDEISKTNFTSEIINAVEPSALHLIGEWEFWLYSVVLGCVIMLTLSVFGIIGNVLSIIILTRHGLNETTNIFLISLSISDFVCSTCSLFRGLRTIVASFGLVVMLNFELLADLLNHVTEITVLVSILHVTSISVERVVAVSFPFEVAKIFTRYRVKCVVIFLYVYGILLYAPSFLCHYVKWEYDPSVNASLGIWTYTDILLNNIDVFKLYSVLFLTISLIVLPLTLTLICSFIIILQLQLLKNKALSKNSSSQVKERKVVKMLLILCCLSVFAFLPSSILDLYTVFSGFERHSSFFRFVVILSPVLYQVNASINFIIYITMSSKFAETYKSLFKSK